MTHRMFTAWTVAFHVIAFATFNALVIKPETPAAWIAFAVAWACGFLLGAWLKDRRDV